MKRVTTEKSDITLKRHWAGMIYTSGELVSIAYLSDLASGAAVAEYQS